MTPGRYLVGVSHTTVAAFGDRATTGHPGTAIPAAPASAVVLAAICALTLWRRFGPGHWD